MAQLQLQSISKSFGGTRVLDGVSLDVRDGEFISLVGASGCGKTTLLRIIAGLDDADAGSVVLGGRDVGGLRPRDRDVAMVFQSYALYPYMTVAQNIGLPLTMRRLSRWQRLPLAGRFWPGSRALREGIAEAVRAVATSLGLGTLLGRKPGQLSGGQRQRVALARAMVRQPQVFLMDEPLSNLDAKLRAQARAEIAQLHRRLGATFVYVTHDQVEAMTMSDRVALMVDGRILQVGPPQALYDDPRDLRVAEFIGTPKINVLPAAAGSRGLQVLGFLWPVDAPQEGELLVGVRPEWWTVEAGLATVDGPGCSLVGRVAHVERLGSETLVHVQVPGLREPLVAKVAPAAAEHLPLGGTLRLSVPAARLLLFTTAGRRVDRDAGASPATLPARHG
jgi:multiple sugar transport system ATP-binding protein